MARKFRESKSIKRRNQPSKKPKIKIVAFCEGKNTEPHFIRDFSNLYGNGMVSIKCIAAAGVPNTIVDSCVSEKATMVRNARRTKDPLDSNFQVWAVFDRDIHHNISAAFDKAHANKINIAYSNPCFELWPYLYLKQQSAPIHRHDMQRSLERELAGYDKDSSKSVCLDSLNKQGCYNTAKERAITLSNRHKEEGTDYIEANPSTNAYLLFDEIINNGKVQ